MVDLYRGSQGFQGYQGVRGYQGYTGRGVQGYQGASGAQGAQGATGSGSQGFQGVSGAQGAQGATGTGSQGFQGATGSQGSQGSQGFQGVAGSQGSQGFQGATGTGNQGFQGVAGSQGSQGFQGATGTGSQGAQGAQGAAGSGGSGGGIFSFAYTFNSTAGASGISTGQLRANTGAISGAITLIVHDTDADGNSFDNIMNTAKQLVRGSLLSVRKTSAPAANFGIYEISSVTVGGSYTEFTVKAVAFTGAISNGDAVSLTFDLTPSTLGATSALVTEEGNDTYGLLGNFARPFLTAGAAVAAGASHLVLGPRTAGGSFGDISYSITNVNLSVSAMGNGVTYRAALGTISTTGPYSLEINCLTGPDSLQITSVVSNGTFNNPGGNITVIGATITSGSSVGYSIVGDSTDMPTAGGTITLRNCRFVDTGTFTVTGGSATPSTTNTGFVRNGGSGGQIIVEDCHIYGSTSFVASGGTGGTCATVAAAIAGGAGGNAGGIAIINAKTHYNGSTITVSAFGGVGGAGSPADMYGASGGAGGAGGPGGVILITHCEAAITAAATGGVVGAHGDGTPSSPTGNGGPGGTITVRHSTEITALNSVGGTCGAGGSANGGTLNVSHSRFGTYDVSSAGAGSNGVVTMSMCIVSSATASITTSYSQSYYNVINGTSYDTL